MAADDDKFYIRPGQVANLQGVISKNNSILWTWTYADLGLFDGFRIFDQTTGQLITTISPQLRRWIMKPITIGQPYSIIIRTFNRMQEGFDAVSPVVTLVPTATPIPLPLSPLNLIGTVISPTQIKWTWTDRSSGTGMTFLYDADGHRVGFADIGKTSYTEFVDPATEYRRFVTTTIDGLESIHSTIAIAITPALPADIVIEDIELLDPKTVVCEVLPREEANARLKAFKNGIGDRLDLKVKVDQQGLVKESFDYTMQLRAYVDREVTAYAKQEFQFRFHGVGQAPVFTNTVLYNATLNAYPQRHARFTLQAQKSVPMISKYNILADVVYDPYDSFTWRIKADMWITFPDRAFSGPFTSATSTNTLISTVYNSPANSITVSGSTTVANMINTMITSFMVTNPTCLSITMTSFVVLTSNSRVIGYCDDMVGGAAPVKAYTTSVDLPSTFTLTSAPYEYPVTDNYYDANHTVIGNISTTGTIMGAVFVDYISQHGLRSAAALISNYRTVDLNTTVVSLTSSDGASPVKLYTTFSTQWYGEWIIVQEVHGLKPVVQNLIGFKPVNRYGVAYDDITSVTYTSIPITVDPQISITISPDNQSLVLTANDIPLTNSWIGTAITGNTTSQDARTRVPLPSGQQWNSPAWELLLTEHGPNILIWFTGDPSAKSETGPIYYYGNNPMFIITATQTTEFMAWTATSPWFAGSVNGKIPFLHDGDGYQPMSAPVSMLLPTGIRELTYTIELDKTNSPDVFFTLQKGSDSTTTAIDDQVTFYCEVQQGVTSPQLWTGVAVDGSGPYDVTENTLDIIDTYPSPSKDPTALNFLTATPTLLALYNYEMVITSNNANVQITYDIPPNWAPDLVNVPITLHAVITNTAQTGWHPLIHSGYYYLNQSEHFLYVDKNVKGEVKTINGFTPVPFTYTIQLDAITNYPEGWVEFADNTQIEFARGQMLAAQLDGDSVVIARDGNLEYVAEGTYISSPKIFPYAPTSWGLVTTDITALNGSSFAISTSSRNSGGDWSEYKPLGIDGSIASPLSDAIKYRVTMSRGNDSGSFTFITNQSTFESQSAGRTLLNTIVNAIEGGSIISTLDPTQPGVYISRVFDIGSTHITTMGTGSFTLWPPGNVPADAINRVILLTSTADTPSGPWSIWEAISAGHIVSPANRYIRYRLEMDPVRSPQNFHYAIDFLHTTYDIARSSNVTINSVGELVGIDLTQSSTYVSSIIDTHVVVVQDWGVYFDTVVIPTNGSMVVQTITDNNYVLLNVRANTPAEWSNVNRAGSQVSSPFGRYIKFKIILSHGRSSGFTTQWTDNDPAQFNQGTTSGTTVDLVLDGVRLTDNRINGTFLSRTMDFGEGIDGYGFLTKSWVDAYGSITIVTQSSSNGTTWNVETALGSSGEVLSVRRRYLRYKAYINFGTHAEAQPAFTDIGFISDPITAGTFTQSGSFNTPDISSFGLLTHTDTIGGNASRSSVVLFTDDFNRANSLTTLGSPWVAVNGTWGIISNQAYSVSDFNLNIAILPTVGTGDYTIETAVKGDVVGAAYRTPNIVFRYIDTSNHLICVIENGVLSLVKRDLGVWNPLNSISVSVTDNTLYTLKIVAIGADIELYVDGVLKVSYTLLGADAIKFGTDRQAVGMLLAQAGGTIAARWDYITISSIASSVGGSLIVQTSTDSGTSWQTVTGGVIASTPRTTLQYRATLTPGFGTATTHSVSDSGIVGQVDTYISPVLDMNGFVNTWDQLVLVANDLTGIVITAFTATASTAAEALSSPTWVPVTSPVITGGNTFTAHVASAANQYVRFKVSVALTATPAVTATPPWVNVVWVSGEVNASSWQPFQATSISNVNINWNQTIYTSPILQMVSLSGESFALESVRVAGLGINDVLGYNLESPKVLSINLTISAFQTYYTSPILNAVTIKGFLEAAIISNQYSVSATAQVAADTHLHKVSTSTLYQIMSIYLKSRGIEIDSLLIGNYSLVNLDSSIILWTSNYNNGSDYAYARTDALHPMTFINDNKVLFDEGTGTALIIPAPHQGSPVIVKDQRGYELRQVNFMNEQGDLSLLNVEYFESDGIQSVVALQYTGIDPNSIIIYLDSTGSGQWDQVAPLLLPVYTSTPGATPSMDWYHNFVVCNSTLHLPQVYPKGAYFKITYALLGSFMVDYNYDPLRGYAKVYLYQGEAIIDPEISIPILEVSSETQDDSAYYIAQEINLNPMMNVLQSGFIYLADTVEPAVKLEIYGDNQLVANGYDRTTIRVIAKDRWGNPVIGDSLLFSMNATESPNSSFYTTAPGVQVAVTDDHGMAVAIFIAGSSPGYVTLSIEDHTANISATKVIGIAPPGGQARINVTSDKTSVLNNNVDRALISAQLTNAGWGPVANERLFFECNAGTLSIESATTDFQGKVSCYFTASSDTPARLAQIHVWSVSPDAKQYMNINIFQV